MDDLRAFTCVDQLNKKSFGARIAPIWEGTIFFRKGGG